MLVEVDADSGAVRVDDDGFDALRLAARDGTGDRRALAAVATGGLDAALAAVEQPLVTWQLTVASATVRQVHRAWVVPDTAALLVGVRPGLRQLMAIPPAYVASALVRLTRLQPRRTHDRSPRACRADRLEALVAPDPDVRAAALAEVGAGFGWRLTVGWAEEEVHLTAVDGPDGPFLADPDEAVLRPTTNTSLYRLFATVLPPAAVPEAG